MDVIYCKNQVLLTIYNKRRKMSSYMAKKDEKI